MSSLPKNNSQTIALDEEFPTVSRTEPIQRSEVLGPLWALADDTRLQIMELLALNETLLAQEIIAQLDVGQSTVSRHLQQLVAAGFITEQRTGDANKTYRLHPDRVQDLFARLHQLLTAANVEAILTDARHALPEALQRFVDRDGLVMLWPRREKDRAAVMEYLVNKFERNHLYTEEEVNDLLNQWCAFQDAANMRRQLVDFVYLDRTSSGDKYWRER